MAVENFIQQYFIDPIIQNGWFNPVNTITYGIILVIAVFVVYKILVKMKIPIDWKFFLAILPFIFWGSSTRVLHDAAVAGVLSPELNEFYSSLIFPTPGSYIITFILAFTVFLVSVGVQKFLKFPYWKLMFVVGLILAAWNIYLLPIAGFFPFGLVMGVALFWIAVFFGIDKALKKYYKGHKITGLLTTENQGILGAHFLDASATFIALSYFGYSEQHVVPRLIMPILGPAGMFFLKIVVLLPVLWIIDQYAEEKDKPGKQGYAAGNFKNFLKIVILILGLAPGLRDLIRLMVGV